MALLFDADSEYVSYGSNSVLDSANLGPAFTIMVWVYLTTIDTNYPSIIEKFDSGESSGWQLIATDWWDGSRANHVFFTRVATTNQEVSTNDDALSLNTWQCIAVRTRTIGTVPNIYVGDLSTALALQGTQASNGGSGSIANDGANNLLLSRNIVDNIGIRGRIAFVGIWDEDMSLGQLLAQQYRPHVTSTCVLFSYPGLHGTTTCPDHSGNSNTGTITNATICPNVPLGPPFGFDSHVPYAIAAAGGPYAESRGGAMRATGAAERLLDMKRALQGDF